MRLIDRIIELECEMKCLKSVLELSRPICLWTRVLNKGNGFYHYNLIDVVQGIVDYLGLEPEDSSSGFELAVLQSGVAGVVPRQKRVVFKKIKKEKGNCGKLDSD